VGGAGGALPDHAESQPVAPLEPATRVWSAASGRPRRRYGSGRAPPAPPTPVGSRRLRPEAFASRLWSHGPIETLQRVRDSVWSREGAPSPTGRITPSPSGIAKAGVVADNRRDGDAPHRHAAEGAGAQSRQEQVRHHRRSHRSAVPRAGAAGRPDVPNAHSRGAIGRGRPAERHDSAPRCARAGPPRPDDLRGRPAALRSAGRGARAPSVRRDADARLPGAAG